ncbi:MAG: cytochrome c [Thioalkalispiraceae bacterium]|jgi:cytochrome c556
MKFKHTFIVIALLISVITPVSNAQDKHTDTVNLELSTGLMDLLRTEMREILSGVQTIPSSIAMADWKKIADISNKIKSSYILEQKITPEQKNELQRKLPEYFKRMDKNFHMEAVKLESAARSHDPQLVTFHYYRLIESCASCHSTYATKRFPGFLPEKSIEHHH